MNLHVLQGTVVFAIWSIFSVWYYVTHIKGEDQTEIKQEMRVPELLQAADPMDDTTAVEEAKAATPLAIDWHLNLYFNLNTTDITNQSDLITFMDSVKNMPASSSYLLVIEGYTCDLGSEEYNDALSKARANKIADLILPALNENIKPNITGKGASNPMIPNNNEENRSKNRRVEIHLTN